MCWLILCQCEGDLHERRLHPVIRQLCRVVDLARSTQQPLAYIICARGAGFARLGLRIDRSEPVFSVAEGRARLPDGVIDFVVEHAAFGVRLAGIAETEVFEQVHTTLTNAGIATRIETKASLPVLASYQRF